MGMYKRLFKRILDILLSFSLLIILSPVFLLIALLVRIKLGSPVLFTQERPGKDGKIFSLYKFRSMTNEVDEYGHLLPNEVRLTSFGKTLRSTSLDELPELWNILKGEMSFIGPRPLLVEYLHLYSDTQKKRHEVRPGLTGLAQVNGRNTVDWQNRFLYDIEYVNNLSFLLDLKILFKTVFVVLKREGISSGTSTTMEPFKGNEDEK